MTRGKDPGEERRESDDSPPRSGTDRQTDRKQERKKVCSSCSLLILPRLNMHSVEASRSICRSSSCPQSPESSLYSMCSPEAISTLHHFVGHSTDRCLLFFSLLMVERPVIAVAGRRAPKSRHGTFTPSYVESRDV